VAEVAAGRALQSFAAELHAIQEQSQAAEEPEQDHG